MRNFSFSKGALSTALLIFGTAANAQSRYDNLLIDVEVNDSTVLTFVKTPDLFQSEWDTLAQPNFWRFVMQVPPSVSILNVAATRQILEVMPLSQWDLKGDAEKELYKDSLCLNKGLDTTTRVFMTTGKSDFYAFDKVFPSITRGVDKFIEYDTDPWYAQAILMIESPGRIAYSNAGAYGPFQLMRSVARAHGLRVDSSVDERKDFDKSAYGSSHLLRTACIPEAKRILNQFGIPVRGEDEFSLWFRLVVLHIYHAGAGNVNSVLTQVVKPSSGGKSLITSIWKSEYGNFGNSSQNYSQLALAALIVLDDLIHSRCLEICDYNEEG